MFANAATTTTINATATNGGSLSGARRQHGVAHRAAATFAPDDVNARLAWLVQADGYAEQRRRLFRTPREEEERLSMRRPYSSRKAYALLGLLLGLLPPAVIFYRIFGYGLGGHSRAADEGWLLLLCLAMNTVSAVAGCAMGSVWGRQVDALERSTWHGTVLGAIFMGLTWGAVTGMFGGLLFFGVGAVAGIFCAVPVGAVAYLLFTPLHRLLARGGMIDARHFWPLACGVTFSIAALILNS